MLDIRCKRKKTHDGAFCKVPHPIASSGAKLEKRRPRPLWFEQPTVHTRRRRPRETTRRRRQPHETTRRQRQPHSRHSETAAQRRCWAGQPPHRAWLAKSRPGRRRESKSAAALKAQKRGGRQHRRTRQQATTYAPPERRATASWKNAARSHADTSCCSDTATPGNRPTPATRCKG